MLCKKLSHAAYRCRDARETVEFYTEVLELKFRHALGSDRVPSTQEYDPHIHIFFELEDGSSIAFFEVPHSPGAMKDERMHDWIQHFAFEVADKEAVLHAKAALEARAIPVLGPIDHGGFFYSIYFHDPSGHRLELTAHTGTTAMRAEAAANATRLLEIWNKQHAWDTPAGSKAHG